MNYFFLSQGGRFETSASVAGRDFRDGVGADAWLIRGSG